MGRHILGYPRSINTGHRVSDGLIFERGLSSCSIVRFSPNYNFCPVEMEDKKGDGMVESAVTHAGFSTSLSDDAGQLPKVTW